MNFDIGDRPRSTVVFLTGKSAADPFTVTVKVRKPDDTETIFSGPVSALPPEIVKESTGTFRHAFLLDLSGQWSTRWLGSDSSGNVTSSDETKLTVRESEFVDPLAIS